MNANQDIHELLNNAKQTNHQELTGLSSLNDDTLKDFQSSWFQLLVTKRREIIQRLVSLAEDNLELDFDNVFLCCIKDEDNQVRAASIEGLWECEDRKLIPLLSYILRDDPATEVRAKAAVALSRFALLAHLGKLINKDAQQIMSILKSTIDLTEEDIEVKRRAVESIGAFDTKEVHEIIQLAYQHRDRRMKYSAIYAMGKSNNPYWIPNIVRELQSVDPEMRYEATNACGEMAEEDLIPELLELFEDEDIEIQASAVSAVGNIGGDMARRVLLNSMNAGNSQLAEVAEIALEKLDAGEDLSNMSMNPYGRLSD